jgi:CheY-like chemotaxis protein
MAATILLADDDKDDALIFQEALDEAECNATFLHANTGANVFTLLEKGARPDIIFLDLNMPVMNGWQCLAKLKNSEPYKDIPVVMYTTSSNPRDYQVATDLNADGLITKPSNPKVLSRLLKTLICSFGTTGLSQALKNAYLLMKDKTVN